MKGKAEAGKQWAKSKIYGGDDSPEGKQKRLDKALDAGAAAVNRLPGSRIAQAALKPVLGSIRLRYGLTSLVGVRSGDRWEVHGELNPRGKKATTKQAGAPDTDVEDAKKLAGSRLKGLDSAGTQHDATVGPVDEPAKRVSLTYSAMLGQRRLIRVAHATIKDLLDAVKAHRPVPMRDLKELTHPSKLVENVNGKFLLVKALRQTVDAEGPQWRKKLYGGFSLTVKQWKKDMLSTPYEGTDVKNGVMEPADAKLHITNRRYWARGNRYDPQAGSRFESTLDHDPAVVAHWNDGKGGTRAGRYGVQSERKAFFSAGPFEILPRFLNSSEGSAGEKLDPEVGQDFRGPGET